MLVKLTLPPVRGVGYKKRILDTGHEVVNLPIDQPDVLVEIPEHASITVNLYNVDGSGGKAEPIVCKFTTDHVPAFIPGHIRVELMEKPKAVPPKLGGDQTSKPEVEDSGKKEVKIEEKTVTEVKK